jgi:hypothetical protein
MLLPLPPLLLLPSPLSLPLLLPPPPLSLPLLLPPPPLLLLLLPIPTPEKLPCMLTWCCVFAAQAEGPLFTILACHCLICRLVAPGWATCRHHRQFQVQTSFMRPLAH